MIGSKVMATRLDGFCLVTKGGYISGKGLVEKEAMERKHSEEEADLYDPEGQSWTNTAALSPVQK